ncbi:hypothetical protein BJ508DRAFT_307840 [Ascobolus immersus RN42]|uniref:Uncharacterized protein n=1 Tax=Ascobolus immersus RN42 TaxID=1160509 RepID=A0A3N4I5I0_ASCIM|nr:hypothetical protein BJ508DRAFT_307840 [Ascobolus immersus RN42]
MNPLPPATQPNAPLESPLHSPETPGAEDQPNTTALVSSQNTPHPLTLTYHSPAPPPFFRPHHVETLKHLHTPIPTRPARYASQDIPAKLRRKALLWKEASAQGSEHALERFRTPDKEETVPLRASALDEIRLGLENHNKLLSEKGNLKLRFTLAGTVEVLGRVVWEITWCFKRSGIYEVLVGLDEERVRDMPRDTNAAYTGSPKSPIFAPDPKWRNLRGVYQALVYVLLPATSASPGPTGGQGPDTVTVDKVVRLELEKLVTRAVSPARLELVKTVLCTILERWSDVLYFLKRLCITITTNDNLTDIETVLRTNDDPLDATGEVIWKLSGRHAMDRQAAVGMMVDREMGDLPWHPQELDSQVKLLQFLVGVEEEIVERIAGHLERVSVEGDLEVPVDSE